MVHKQDITNGYLTNNKQRIKSVAYCYNGTLLMSVPITSILW